MLVGALALRADRRLAEHAVVYIALLAAQPRKPHGAALPAGRVGHAREVVQLEVQGASAGALGGVAAGVHARNLFISDALLHVVQVLNFKLHLRDGQVVLRNLAFERLVLRPLRVELRSQRVQPLRDLLHAVVVLFVLILPAESARGALARGLFAGLHVFVQILGRQEFGAALVRTLYGLKLAALEMETPLAQPDLFAAAAGRVRAPELEGVELV